MTFEEKLDLVAQLILRARAHYDVWWIYEGADTKPDHIDVLNRYVDFFHFDIHAHLVAMVMYLSQLLEPRTDTLVHEFREPGYGAEAFAEDSGSPCYHGYVNDPRFYLVYPVDLFRSIAQAAVDGIESYFLEQQLDPYDRIGDTSRW